MASQAVQLADVALVASLRLIAFLTLTRTIQFSPRSARRKRADWLSVY